MNRILTAVALSALIAAPAFARKHTVAKPATVEKAGDKAVSGDSKAPAAEKVAGDTKTETKTETKAEAAPADGTAKPAKKVKKSKKAEKTTETAAPAAGSEAPATK